MQCSVMQVTWSTVEERDHATKKLEAREPSHTDLSWAPIYSALPPPATQNSSVAIETSDHALPDLGVVETTLHRIVYVLKLPTMPTPFLWHRWKLGDLQTEAILASVPVLQL